ncbi:GNAT family N-acetyltransferase [Catenulispora pinisilvae]|uniref:GNAT family N-acetyltransferase n=1 Tax=Catenulispora pinisilvae TaxID=2705253 RepID=UPI0018924367|nr:GNAT family N-acetyltransferase [Catenulispora pinisilvae]
MSVEIEVLQTPTAEIVEAFARLLPQLSSSAAPLDADALSRLADWPGLTTLLARHDTAIVGTLTLVTFPTPTGLRAWIEDVVVDESARGLGVGAALTKDAIRRAQEAGARSLDLTSRASRAAANRLYERLGFAVRDSKLYRFAG